MLTLNHPNIVPLLGISLMPLCLVLSLAPQGSLDNHLQDYQRAGARFPVFIIQRVIIQVCLASGIWIFFRNFFHSFVLSSLTFLYKCFVIIGRGSHVPLSD